MPGNELDVCRYLMENIGNIELPHLGKVKTIGAPNPSSTGYTYITNAEHIRMISPGDARKKADIYINEEGVSIKQTGGSFLYNRLQRASIFEVYALLNFTNIDEKLEQIDTEVRRFHEGLLERRNRPWEDFFTEDDFKDLLELLMMKYSAHVGFSSHPASLILELLVTSFISKYNE